MTRHYEALTHYLGEQPPDEAVSLTHDEIGELIGGLPPSAGNHRAWWSNSWANKQASSWLAAGRTVTSLQLGDRVVFSPAGAEIGGPSSSGTHGRIGLAPVADGVAALSAVLERAGYPSVVHAVAAHTVFLHPDTVGQVGQEPMFPVVRDMHNPHRFGEIADGRPVFFDDNATPTLCFLWAAQRRKGPDVQYNHIWGDPKNVDTYTALWNLCVTPAFLAKTTDGSNHPEVVAALRCRSFELFGHRPDGEEAPVRPDGYHDCQWAEPPAPVDDLEAVFRRRLAAAPRSRPALVARRLGWRFSEWVPDGALSPEDG